MQAAYNMRNPAVKRLMKEAQELREPTEQYYAQPLEDNLFEWHFTIRGPIDSEFEEGVYHGRIILPPEYPMKPPSIILLTPNGRFEVFKKICLSISGHHPESWQPSWSIRTALLAIIGFMPTHGNGAIGSLDYTTEERKILSRRSQEFKCPDCGTIKDKLKAVTEASKAETQEAKELASQINFQAENKANGKEKGEKQEKESESENKEEKRSTKAASDGSSASSPATTESTNTQVPPSFPGYNPFPGMPFPSGGFPMPPPFMFPPGMVPPPSTSGSGATANPPNPFAMPPGLMMPPFWPPMIPPVSTSTSNPSQMPLGPPFPPFLTSPFLASPAAMLAQQQAMRSYQANSSAATNASASKSQSATTTVSSASASYQSSSHVTSPEEAVPPAATSTASTTDSASTSAAATPSSSSTSAAATPTTSTASSASRSTPTPELRQRNVAQNAGTRAPQATQATQAPQAQGQFQNAALPSEHNIRQSEHPLVILLMVLLGIAILALLVRRVYMMNTWRFDTDF